MPARTVLQSFIDWVRKGYPQGVPQQDYIALIALLGSKLTQDEIGGVVLGLMAAGPDEQNSQAIADAIEMATHEPPSDADVERVRQRLVAAGADFGAAED
jgi:Protein of unknown function (DUF3349)